MEYLLKVSLSFLLLLASFFPTFAGGRDMLAAGPMLGHIDMVEAHVWVQTKNDAAVFLRYRTADSNQTKETETLLTNASDYHTAKFEITDLDENTTYSYEVVIDDEVVKLPYPTQFTTRKFWRYRTDAPDLKLTFGSCFFVNDEKYDRPGKPYGRNFQTMPLLAAEKPDAMFWLGDNVYFRESDFYTRKRLAYRFKHTRGLPDLQEFLANTSHYAIWDDHDYGPNDSNRAYGFKDTALDLHKKYWGNPYFGMPGVPGVFGMVQVGDVDVFMTDNRYYRAPKHLHDPNKDYFGQAQLQWLKDSLINSRAPFKLILSGSQMINPYSPYEGLQNYPGERENLFAFLKQHNISGVIFVSGDRHHSELLKQPRPRTYPLHEFTVSPLSAGLADVSGGIEENNPIRVPNTLVNDKHNYGVMEVKGPKDARVLTMKIIDREGTTRWSHSVKEDELRKASRRK